MTCIRLFLGWLIPWIWPQVQTYGRKWNEHEKVKLFLEGIILLDNRCWMTRKQLPFVHWVWKSLSFYLLSGNLVTAWRELQKKTEYKFYFNWLGNKPTSCGIQCMLLSEETKKTKFSCAEQNLSSCLLMSQHFSLA